MSEKAKVYSYRWVVLAVFMFINLTIQVLWITYAPITGNAAEFYSVTDLQIGLLSMVFMIAFIPLSIPAWTMITVIIIKRPNNGMTYPGSLANSGRLSSRARGGGGTRSPEASSPQKRRGC